jgi:hypothetical protein
MTRRSHFTSPLPYFIDADATLGRLRRDDAAYWSGRYCATFADRPEPPLGAITEQLHTLPHARIRYYFEQFLATITATRRWLAATTPLTLSARRAARLLRRHIDFAPRDFIPAML